MSGVTLVAVRERTYRGGLLKEWSPASATC